MIDTGIGIIGIAQDPRHVRYCEKGVDLECGGDCLGREVGVDIVRMRRIAGFPSYMITTSLTQTGPLPIIRRTLDMLG